MSWLGSPLDLKSRAHPSSLRKRAGGFADADGGGATLSAPPSSVHPGPLFSPGAVGFEARLHAAIRAIPSAGHASLVELHSPRPPIQSSFRIISSGEAPNGPRTSSRPRQLGRYERRPISTSGEGWRWPCGGLWSSWRFSWRRCPDDARLACRDSAPLCARVSRSPLGPMRIRARASPPSRGGGAWGR